MWTIFKLEHSQVLNVRKSKRLSKPDYSFTCHYDEHEGKIFV